MIYTNIFDTHSHYDDEAFDSDREELILSLKDKGVVGVVSCGCDIPSTAANRDLAHKLIFTLRRVFIPKIWRSMALTIWGSLMNI